MIVLVGNSKGGVGKSTIATNLAVESARKASTILVDTDPQGSSHRWAQVRREAELEPSLTCVKAGGRQLHKELLDLRERFEVVLVDAGGRDSPEIRAASVVADLVLVPVLASQSDLWAAFDIQEVLTLAAGFRSDGRVPAWFVLNQAPTHHRATETPDAQELLGELEFPMVRTHLRHRKAYRDAFSQGRAVTELGAYASAARGEVRRLFSELGTLAPTEVD